MRQQDFELHVKVVGWLHILESLLYLLGGGLVITFFTGIGIAAQDPEALGILSVVGFSVGSFIILVGIPVLIAGWGLLTRKSWSRVLAMVLAILGLFLFPIGTIVGLYVLWVLTAEPAAAYFGDTALSGEPGQGASS